MSDLTQFSQMLALRYNGTNPGYGVVTRFSVWNEPNLGSFLSPQFSSSGKIVSPGTYAKLYMAAYKGIKAGNKVALVAAGETSNRGLNHHVPNATDSVAPATFAHLLSVANPKLPFDAWATHPYPSGAYTLGPAQRVAYPNVGFSTMSRFGADLQKWFQSPGSDLGDRVRRADEAGAHRLPGRGQLCAAGRRCEEGAPARRGEPVRADVRVVHLQGQHRGDVVQRRGDEVGLEEAGLHGLRGDGQGNGRPRSVRDRRQGGSPSRWPFRS